MRSAPVFTLLAALGIAAACSEPTNPDSRTSRVIPAARSTDVDDRLLQILQRGGVFAEGTYLACLESYLGMGIPMREIQKLCAVNLDSLDAHGWGASGGPFQLPPRTPPGFDPNSVTSACNAGDPLISGGPKGSEYMIYNGAGTSFPVGDFSWGGKGESPFAGYVYLGLSKEESLQKKLDAARELVDRYVEYQDAKEAAAADPKNAQLQADLAKAEKAYMEAQKKAVQDPNLAKKVGALPSGDPGHSSTADGSACQTVLQVARELFAECHRSGWKAPECQQLHARMNKCPDPTLIHVDPDAGYACGAAVDPQLVIDAWRAECEQNTTPGPDGTSPCSKPVPSESGRTMQSDDDDYCISTIARTDPETDGCIKPMILDDFGKSDPLGLIIWGQGVFGGPIVVLPLPKPPIVIKGG